MIYDFTPDEVQGLNLTEELLAEQYEKLAETLNTIAALHRTRAKAWLNMGRRQQIAIKKETQEIQIGQLDPSSNPDSSSAPLP